jgi:hypothetical protein
MVGCADLIIGRYPSSDGMSRAQGIRADPLSESPANQTKLQIPSRPPKHHLSSVSRLA